MSRPSGLSSIPPAQDTSVVAVAHSTRTRLIGVLRSIRLSGIDHAIFNKTADALPQGQGIMVAWTIGPYAMKIKNVELLAITAVERISQRCGLPIRSGRRSLAPRSVRTVRKKATQKHRT
jgi:hypothetical protein